MNKIALHFKLAFAFCLFLTANIFAQFSFTNSNDIIGTPTHSGCAVTVVDVNNDGFDDLLIMDESINLTLKLQQKDGTYTETYLGTVPDNSNVWGMAVADVDHNGWKDVATGSGRTHLFKLFESGGVVSATITTLNLNYFVQNLTFGDFNNDGWVDLAVCDDNDYMKVYTNNNGTFNNIVSAASMLINTNINAGFTVGSDPYDSGNYGSVWTDFDNDGDLDLYIAHCRQAASSPSDVRRRDRLFVNNGANVFTEMSGSYGIESAPGLYKQTWTTSFGDIDNDGDQDIVMTNHGENSQILQNNGTGHFTDITATTGLVTNFDAIESYLEDFDNDGFLDILITGPNWRMYHNNGNSTFSDVPSVFAGTNLLSFGTGDLNHDGKVDVFASYGNVYNTPTSMDDVLYLNTTTNTNHFINFDLRGTQSAKDAIGAKVIIYGAFGLKVREVRSGESYGTTNSFTAHFGLGHYATIDSAVVKWPSGLKSHFGQLAADQFVTSVENGCSISNNIISGTGILCTGQNTTLLAPAGYASYLWSNNATTQSINVNSTGTYNVMVTSNQGCTNVSSNRIVSLNPDETPIVSVAGLNNPCAGTLTLSSSPASSYVWSGPNGFNATTQSISPNVSGSYAVTINGVCGNFSSLPTAINVLATPSPVGNDETGVGPATFTLTANTSGGSLNWYNQTTGGTLLAAADSYTTPIISATTTYYVEEVTYYPGEPGEVGPKYHSGSSYFSANTTNSNIVFNVLSDCTLRTVKMYTDSAGVREIQLKNSFGTIINSLMLYFPANDTMLVNLNWALAAGLNYQITTNGAVNAANLGTVSPRLLRSNLNILYPYTLNNFVSLTGSSQGSNVYYYFYDWQLEGPSYVCTSPRVPVVAIVSGLTGISNTANTNGISIYPNPATDEVNVLFASASVTTTLQIMDISGRIITTYTVSKPSSGQMAKIDLSGISAGTYFISTKSDVMNKIQKLVVAK